VSATGAASHPPGSGTGTVWIQSTPLASETVADPSGTWPPVPSAPAKSASTPTKTIVFPRFALALEVPEVCAAASRIASARTRTSTVKGSPQVKS
jgi:hypothetical protein